MLPNGQKAFRRRFGLGTVRPIMQFEFKKCGLSAPPWWTIVIVQWDAEATLVNRIHTPTVVSIHHHAVRQGALALRLRTLSGYDSGLAKLAQAEIKEAAAPKIES